MNALYYYAKIEYSKNDNAYVVSFPQFPNVNTFGKTLDEALQNAEDALNGCLQSDFERHIDIPKPIEYRGDNYYKIKVYPWLALILFITYNG